MLLTISSTQPPATDLGYLLHKHPSRLQPFPMSVMIAKVVRTVMTDVCKNRPELANTSIPLMADIPVLPYRGGESFLRELFEPLGYANEN